MDVDFASLLYVGFPAGYGWNWLEGVHGRALFRLTAPCGLSGGWGSLGLASRSSRGVGAEAF
jgi:hypothetical protein